MKGLVGTLKLEELFKKNLNIPNFQRPYSWQQNQVKELLLDLIQAHKENKEYLIGNVIFYEDNEKLDIIDGQQRITTLALIFKVLGYETAFLNKSINSLSQKRLIENYQIIQNFFRNIKEDILNFLKENIYITYIKTNNLDEAFVLFDSQNTRGKPLKRKDILKVHHLHLIQNRRIYAKKWEEWEKIDNDILEEVLYLISFIRKGIRKELSINHLEYIDVFKELKTSSKEYRLNNYNQPPIFENFEFDFEKNVLSLITKPIKKMGELFIDGVYYLPFEINSSIVGGEKFFAYVWKYVLIYRKLKQNEMFTKLDNLSGSGNIFLSKIYVSSLFFYYDKFEYQKFDEFSKKLFILLLYLRILKKSIRKEKVLSYQWNDNKSLDFFKLILLSYSPDEVIEKVDDYIKFNLNLEKFKIELNGTKKRFFDSFNNALEGIIDEK